MLAWLGASLSCLVLWSVVGGMLPAALVLGGATAVQAADEPAANAKTEDGGKKQTLLEKSLLQFYFESLGWRYTIAFLIISFVGVALVVMCFLMARREAVLPAHLLEGFEGHLNEKRYQEAYEMAKNDPTMLGQVLAAGMAKLSGGYDQAVTAMEEVGTDEAMKMEHKLSYIALVGTVAPMVGLLGTVDGMVQSFIVIASSDTTPKPSKLAEGISTALITTLVGLVIAIPAVAVYAVLKNRISRLIYEVGILSGGLMSRFQKAEKKP
jgi:biopolymer transport protein ExbB